MSSVRKTAPSVSTAVKEFLSENSIELDSVNVNLVDEKIFTDKKEYTVEIAKRFRSEPRPFTTDEADINISMDILDDMLRLMDFYNFKIESNVENNYVILKIITQGKDGLLIGKNGQNLLAIQYLLSIILDKELKKHLPLIIDVDNYREKRISYLKNLCRTISERAISDSTEVITELLPSYERKLIHEELTGNERLKTFSIGRGAYKKVVVTALL